MLDLMGSEGAQRGLEAGTQGAEAVLKAAAAHDCV
jgi:hypothetical protein